jgi:hypothetical protein
MDMPRWSYSALSQAGAKPEVMNLEFNPLFTQTPKSRFTGYGLVEKTRYIQPEVCALACKSRVECEVGRNVGIPPSAAGPGEALGRSLWTGRDSQCPSPKTGIKN